MPPHKVIGVIPARYGSTRFPRKMLADVNGKPLIQQTYENALRCDKLDTLLVATDHPDIYDAVTKFGGKVVMTSNSCLTGTDRIAEAVRNDSSFEDCDIIINIQGDEPRLDPTTIRKVAEILEEDSLAQVSTACVRIVDPEEAFNTSTVKCVMDFHGHALYFSRALIPHGINGVFDPKTVYYKHLGIYGYRKQFLQHYADLEPTPLQLAENLEQLKILENGICIHIVEVPHDTVGIDTPEDLKKLLMREVNS